MTGVVILLAIILLIALFGFAATILRVNRIEQILRRMQEEKV